MKIYNIIILILSLVAVAIAIYICVAATQNRGEPFSTPPPLTQADFFEKLYNNYMNQEWPIESSISHTPPLLNVAFPDDSIVYYVASFNSADTVTLSGKIPPNIYFWSLTLYDTDGLPTKSWNYTLFPDSSYSVILGPNNNIPPSGAYCVIQRVYKTSSTPKLFPDFVPNISIATSSVVPVAATQRISNSNDTQNLLWNLFQKQFGSTTPNQLFPSINVNEFFLPGTQQMASVFPNPFAQYLVVFPTTNQVIKVVGTLPNPIGFNEPVLFISYMASNMNHTSTDDSISFNELPTNYTLYAAFSKESAAQFGYNPSTDKLLLWSSTNTYPVLIYREVSVASDKATQSLALFTQNNQVASVSGQVISSAMGPFYPVATAF